MELAALLKKNKNKLLNAGVALLTLVIVINIYKGQNQAIQILKVQKDSGLKKNEVLAVIGQSEKRIATYRNIFSKKDASLVINTISNIARDSNVKILAINPRAQENRSVYVTYPFDLTLSADNYHAIGRFVSNIENAKEVFFIDKAIIKPIERTAASEVKHGLIVSLTISAITLNN
jgi:hypothetical protein